MPWIASTTGGTVQMTLTGLGWLKPREAAALFCKAAAEAGLYWHRTFAKRHFEHAAHQLYGAKRRAFTTNKAKSKLGIPLHPLKWKTQNLRRQILGPEVVSRATKNRLRIVLTGPEYLNYISKYGIQPSAELKVITDRELQEVADFIGWCVQEEIDKNTTQEKIWVSAGATF